MEGMLGAAKGTGGYATLEQLAADGWSIAITGDGVGLRATAGRGEITVSVRGASTADLAPFLAHRARQASRHFRRQALTRVTDR